MKPLKVLSKFENYFLIRTISFQVHLEAGGYFLLRSFLRLHPQQAGRVGTNSQFLNLILQIRLQKHLLGFAQTRYSAKKLRWPCILADAEWANFLGEKFVLWKSSLIHSILHKTGTITSGFEGKKRKYHFLKNRAILWYALSRAVHKNRTSQVRFSPSKPDLIRPKNTCLIVICFLQAFIEPWEPNDRLHGIPGHDPARESRKTPLEGGRKSMQRERLKYQ